MKVFWHYPSSLPNKFLFLLDFFYFLQKNKLQAISQINTIEPDTNEGNCTLQVFQVGLGRFQAHTKHE